MKQVIAAFLIFIGLHACQETCGKDRSSEASRFVHEAGISARAGYILPTNGFYCGFNPMEKRLSYYAAAAFQYSFAFPESSRYGKMYPSARQGIGIGMYSFGSDEHIGTPLALYIFQGASIASLSEELTIDYEWNLGLSYGWINDSGLTASRTNICLGGGFFLTWRPDARWKLFIGPEFMHHSNGDTSFPNLGTNTVGLRLGASMGFGNREEVHTVARLFAAEEEKKPFGERITYDMTLTAGWRAGRVKHGNEIRKYNNPFPIISLSINPLYHFNRYLSLGPSVEMVLDRSADLIPSAESYAFPSIGKQMAAGVGVKAEVRMNIFALSGGAGYSFGHKGSVMTGWYGIFGLKAFLSERLYINTSYMLRDQRYTHNLTFGLGWRFGKQS